MEPSLENLPKDVLFTMALEFNYPELLRFCRTHPRINNLVCQQNDIWVRKLKEDFKITKLIKSTPRETYEFLYRGLTNLKQKYNLQGTIFYIYYSKFLDLGGENVTEIPEIVFYLPNLKMLSLWNNQIKNVPKEIGNLKNLEQLSLQNNQIEILPREMGKITKLKFLVLRNNPIKILPEEIAKLPNLEEIDVRNTYIEELPNFTNPDVFIER